MFMVKSCGVCFVWMQHSERNEKCLWFFFVLFFCESIPGRNSGPSVWFSCPGGENLLLRNLFRWWLPSGFWAQPILAPTYFSLIHSLMTEPFRWMLEGLSLLHSLYPLESHKVVCWSMTNILSTPRTLV